MPIKHLQQMARLPRLGKLRMGYSEPKGKGKTPKRADAWILSSPHRDLLEQAARLYGGEVQPWDNDGNAEFRLFSKAKEIPVYVTPFEGSQWMELRSEDGSRLVRRCDGETLIEYEEVDEGGQKKNRALPPCACKCDLEDPECRAISRFEFILKDLPELGVWLLETRSINAALEMPQMMEYTRQAGRLVASAFLVFMIRKRRGKVFPVAQLRLKAKPQHLEALTDGRTPLALPVAEALDSTHPALPSSVEEEEVAEGYTEAEFLKMLAGYSFSAPKGIKWLAGLRPPSLDELEALLDRVSWLPEGRPADVTTRLSLAQGTGVKTWAELVAWGVQYGGDPV